MKIGHRCGAFLALGLGLGLAFMACKSRPPETAHESAPVPTVSAEPISDAAPDVALTDIVVDAGSPEASANTVVAVEPPLEGANFVAEVRAIYRVAACGPLDGPLPPNIDADVMGKHCLKMDGDYAEYRKEWLDVAMPFLEKLRPANLPPTVIYPFGGGDLLGGLATYPDGMTFTTISLESASDIRGIMKIDKPRLERELKTLRDHLEKLFLKAHSRTVNMELDSRGFIPGEVAFTMSALVIHGYEPTAFRYFSIQPDGSMHFFTEEELAKVDKKIAFANAETRFQKRGGGPTKILRHVAFDLSDGNLRKNPGLLRYLDKEAQKANGKVSEMTKAASHLLWNDGNFSVIRDWLATHTDFMLSDTTGFPPRIAKQYGFVQDVYGQYEWPEPFGPANQRDATAFHELFKGHAPISFRYGYPDNHSHGHIVVTRRP